MIRSITAHRNVDLLTPATEFVAQHAAAGEVVVLAGVKAAADDLVRAWFGAAAAGVYRFSLRDLASELSALRGLVAGLAPVTRAGREAIAAHITQQAIQDGRLAYFRPVAAMPGFSKALARTLNELRLDRIDANQLGSIGKQGEDLAVLLRLYESELRDRALVDRAARLATAASVASDGDHPIVGRPLLAFCVEPRRALERELIDVLLRQAGDALVAARKSERAEGGATPLESLQRYAFQAPPDRALSGDGSVQIFSASGEALEAVEIARRVLALARSGMRFDSMAVLLRTPARYGRHVQEAFRRAGVPAYFCRATARPDPAGRALLVLLEFAANGFSAADLAEYVSLGQMPRDVRAPVRWEQLIIQAGVGGGRERWQTRLDALNQTLGKKRDEDREYYDRALDALESLREFVPGLIEHLAGLPRAAHWGEWLDALHALADEALARPAAVHAVLDELEPMGEIGPVDLPAVVHVLRDHLRFLYSDTEPSRYGRVFVGAIEDARGMSFRLVLLPGLNEGTFPTRWNQDPLLPDTSRERLGMPGAESDHELFRAAAATASEKLVLSYSSIDLLNGRARVPSFYVFEAFQAAFGESPDVSRIQKEARESVPTRAGWPAPRAPEDAIDDAEFDLAVLRPFMAGGAVEAGAGAYLADASSHLVRALRMRWKRWNARRWWDADGLIDEQLGALDAYRLRVQAYSPTALQEFAACPYRFALRSLFHLRPADRAVQPQHIEPHIRGKLFHQVQAELLRELLAAGALPVSEANLADAECRLDRTLDRVAVDYSDRLAPAIPGVWVAEIERLRADLRGWLRQMTTEPGWVPIHFEWAFGLQPAAGRDPASRTDPVEVLEGYKLSGIIDLIERHQSGALRAVDHKTGAPPQWPPEYIGKGELLQPVLYALTVEHAFESKVLFGRLLYSTLRQNYRAIDVGLTEHTRAKARLALRAIDDALERGFLPAAPREDACNSCDYRCVCGPYEEERTRRKPRADLTTLLEIRRTR